MLASAPEESARQEGPAQQSCLRRDIVVVLRDYVMAKESLAAGQHRLLVKLFSACLSYIHFCRHRVLGLLHCWFGFRNVWFRDPTARGGWVLGL